MPGVVEDRAGHARLAENRFVTLGGHALIADAGDLTPQGGAPEGALGQLGQGFSQQVVEDLAGREGEDRLAERAGMQRQLKTHLEDAERRVRPEDMVDHHHAVPVHHPDPYRRAGSARQPVAVPDRTGPQLVEVQVRVTELEQPGPELVLVRVPVLLHKAMGLQRLQQTVDRGPGQAEAVGQLADAQPAGSAGQRLEDRGGSVDGLDRASSLATIRHC